MSDDPSLALQKAMVAALKAHAGLTALIDGRVYDRVSTTAARPYVSLGNDQLLDDGNACGDAWEVLATVDVWSTEPGQTEVKRIASAVRDALAAELEIEGFTVVSGTHRDTIYLDDPDGTTSHGVVRLTYLIDPA